jgi:Protein of unknown function (DUF3300)
MLKNSRPLIARLVAACAFAALLLAPGGAALQAQDQPAPPPPPPGQALTPDQLDDLVAPIALYPDELVSQVLVAATYPLEVVEAYQFLQKNPGLTGAALTQAAQQQNWDPSVQALVLTPDVVKRLNDDVTWTTNLGNAFLAQQQDVMSAIQRMRQKAQQAGKLQSTDQLTVTDTTQDGQPFVEIEPSNPDVLYVPVYDPVWIWGPPVWYPYPHWIWPPRSVLVGGLYFGFAPGINFGVYFGAGWHGWGGWGWHPGWGARTVIVNNTFIHRYNFNTTHIADVHGTAVWQHNPEHRMGVPYASQAVHEQFRAPVRENLAPRPNVEQTRNAFQQQSRQQQSHEQQSHEQFGNRQVPQNPSPARDRGMFGGMQNSRGAAETHAEHGFSSLGPARSAPAPRAAPPAGGGGRRR